MLKIFLKVNKGDIVNVIIYRRNGRNGLKEVLNTLEVINIKDDIFTLKNNQVYHISQLEVNISLTRENKISKVLNGYS